MLPLIVFGIFTSVAIIMFVILNRFFNKGTTVKERMEMIEKGQKYSAIEDDFEKSLFARVVQRPLDRVANRLLSMSPTNYHTRLEEKLQKAGLKERMPPNRWIGYRLVLGLILPFVLMIVIMIITRSPVQAVGYAVILSLLSNIVMTVRLITGMHKHQDRVLAELPDTLDLITISVEAGLAFDGALDRVIRASDKDLAREFGIALKEMRMGISRREALRGMAERLDVPDLTALLGAIIQADELGVPIANILRIQSVQVREKKRQRIREKSMKAPIKMLFPIILFIFPAIFLVLLGPAVIHFMDIF